ncbi:type II secretion system minor pseudopilin GspI [Thalassotalea sp. PLHSN55]|uniref:type II secretion system minor pseudopilin GspI n=1 Tax=Thalassotalea sp. PLHSN55 TaxID=3435888 RepID=UPI003F842F71
MIRFFAARAKTKGFTLLEVLLAMAVFSIAGIALLSAAQNNFTSLNHLENRMLANWVASNQLVEVTLDSTWPPKNNKKGKVELAGRDWYWQQKVLKTTDKTMRSVEIEVRLDEKAEKPISSLTTYIAQATP